MTDRPSLAFPWPSGHQAAAALTFDLDAEAAILAIDPASRERLSVMSHQAYGPLAGTPRLLAMLRRRDLRATFFVPGFTASRYPDVVRAIVDDGHEVAHHGYLHESAIGMSATDEAAIIDKGIDALVKVTGERPVGYRAPFWELNHHTPDLLGQRGFLYDSSLMDSDVPYVLDVDAGDARGRLVELPVHWGLDDWEQYAYLPGLTGSGVIESPSKAVEMWRLELHAMHDEGDCFVLTLHPFLTGRPGRSRALEGLIDEMQGMSTLWLAPMAEIAEHALTVGTVRERAEPPAP